jgi:folate-dependent phosphoribosylglycinamide formyltransferase PurN
MIKPVFDPRRGKMRVIGFVSGSGKGIVTIIERQKELEAESKCNFEVVGIFTDNPGSKAFSLGQTFNLPVLLNDIHEFYGARNEKINNLKIREDYDKETIRLIEPLHPDFLVFAGYVWVATPTLVKAYHAINAHPADLAVIKDGKRAYAGADGIGAALSAGETKLHSSVHLVTTQVDGGPILLISKPVIVEEDPGLSKKERWRKYLNLVNRQSLLLLPLAVEKLSTGDFQWDEQRNVYEGGRAIPEGVRL